MNNSKPQLGDLVRIKNLGDYILDLRPPSGSIGVIVEIKKNDRDGLWFYVYVKNAGWKFRENEIEVIND